ncbi:ribonuclease P protein component [Phaeobacter inhibens]|uniref:ribonuclease P protein component n=1 Tax=Phaeobacter inhibens TaxID=221822 RepID=UPI000C99DB4F|nr:ribonuclease P protein component [Phaeobacter inhibens]AUQ59845.1 putative ribonuclease P component [Phaeobacter inhibens]AUR09106.1 putative ribonuclease P component [Phaeobacter inhibens]AUR12992.1 putative ribonuclease P component [Phaeobacter inhibens]UWR52476.1 ribonuclease P protein component [Phaeobacter inhibens]UWR68044.1 ribonuclease P protein component [Phaeobacter inhibens]
MTPPETPKDGSAAQGTRSPAVSVCVSNSLTHPLPRPQPDVIDKRRDFLAAARARRQGTKGMMVQGRKRHADDSVGDVIRMGFTCSKKVGNAVARNRAKRRLREVARMILPIHGRTGWDYVLIGRAGETADRPFDDLKNDLIYALKKIHGK